MALLEVKSLGIAFGGLKAVDGFHISVEKGQLYGLIGPNGAGKTTVFNLLTGVYKPDQGQILLDGQSIGGKKTIEINKAGIARTFQNIRLFKDMTVLDLSLIHIYRRVKRDLKRGRCAAAAAVRQGQALKDLLHDPGFREAAHLRGLCQ